MYDVVSDQLSRNPTIPPKTPHTHRGRMISILRAAKVKATGTRLHFAIGKIKRRRRGWRGIPGYNDECQIRGDGEKGAKWTKRARSGIFLVGSLDN